ncbi:MAG TPA: polyprenyl synthetase family protein [Vicinamibacterales bacterium]|nr:polyprenyl synthetase family protein [Vicinamibacterales bacterium]
MRRGKPATHIQFGEAMAILAAFGLLNGAFKSIARVYEPPLASRMTALLSDAVGAEGLIGGQTADLLATDQQITFEMLERIHRGKTGALFSAAASSGALTAGASGDSIAALQTFAKNLGLAFQIIVGG